MKRHPGTPPQKLRLPFWLTGSHPPSNHRLNGGRESIQVSQSTADRAQCQFKELPRHRRDLIGLFKQSFFLTHSVSGGEWWTPTLLLNFQKHSPRSTPAFEILYSDPLDIKYLNFLKFSYNISNNSPGSEERRTIDFFSNSQAGNPP